jgi:hypothetical protein
VLTHFPEHYRTQHRWTQPGVSLARVSRLERTAEYPNLFHNSSASRRPARLRAPRFSPRRSRL